MRYLSVCSGIEAATVAWHALGWTPVAFSEIDPFPRAMLAHHYPGVPNWGDMTRFKDWPDAAIDVLVGGTPCQSFSVAGLRKGLADPRGNLALTYLAIAERYRPRWLVWENVPGVLSSLAHDAPDPCPPLDCLDGDDRPADGATVVVEDEYDADEVHAFACFLAGLSELGYGFGYRSLDAQYFGLAQRRERVFVVGHLGDWSGSAAVLFERGCLSGHPPPSREARKDVAGTLGGSSQSGGFRTTDLDNSGAFIPVANTLQAGGHSVNPIDGTLLPVPILDGAKGRGERGDGSRDGTALGEPGDPMFTLRSVSQHAVAFHENQRAEVVTSDTAGALKVGGGKPGQGYPAVMAFSAKDYGQDAQVDLAPTLRSGNEVGGNANGGVMPAVAYPIELKNATRSTGNTGVGTPGTGIGEADAPAGTLRQAMTQAVGFADLADPVAANQARTYTREGAHNFRMSNVAHTAMQVRRLTPRECERLQGFPDDYTLIPYRGKPAADGPRYKALGNSMAVPVMRWIGRRIQLVEEIKS